MKLGHFMGGIEASSDDNKSRLFAQVRKNGKIVMRIEDPDGIAELQLDVDTSRAFWKWIESHYATPTQHETAKDAENHNETDS